MKALRFVIIFCMFIFAVLVMPVMAADETTCTAVPGDANGLPECSTRHDNECYPGGALYREDNQDGCPSEWYWKAGWYLARLNDGKITRSEVPDEFASVLPPVSETEEPKTEEPLGSCTAIYDRVGIEDFESHWVPQPGQWSGQFRTNSLAIAQNVGPSTNSIRIYGFGSAPGESVQFTLFGDGGSTILLTFSCTYSEK